MVPGVAGSNPVYRPSFTFDHHEMKAALLYIIGASFFVLMALVSHAKPTKFKHAIDLSYGANESQKLDVVFPKASTPAPVVVFFHGGSWRWGVKDFYRDIGEEFAKEGVVFVLADYRLFPEVRFPSFVEDAAAAVKWTRDNVALYHGDPERIFLMGHSSGAHIVSHLAMNERYLTDVGGGFSWIKGAVGLSGPYTFQPSTEWLYRDVFDPLAASPKVVPITLVDGDEPPFLVLHGRHDWLVEVKQAEDFAQRIRSKGGKVSLRIYNFHGHFSMMRRATSWYIWPQGILKDILSFMDGKPISDPDGEPG